MKKIVTIMLLTIVARHPAELPACAGKAPCLAAHKIERARDIAGRPCFGLPFQGSGGATEFIQINPLNLIDGACRQAIVVVTRIRNYQRRLRFKMRRAGATSSGDTSAQK